MRKVISHLDGFCRKHRSRFCTRCLDKCLPTRDRHNKDHDPSVRDLICPRRVLEAWPVKGGIQDHLSWVWRDHLYNQGQG